MRKSRFSEEQIIGVLREQEAGLPTAEVCRKHGISEQAFYRWKARYGGMAPSDAAKLKSLEEENRRQKVTDAAAHDGARLREGLIDPTNTASDVWADTAYRSQANEEFLADRGKTSRIHRRKPAGKPMPPRTARANAGKSTIRARVEHVFAEQKARMNLVMRSIGIKRAEATIVMANIAYNLGRWRWWQGRAVPA